MHPLKTILFLLSLSLGYTGFAQPFTLNDKIKPIELKLQEDTRNGHEGELFVAVISYVDTTKYYYVSGHSMFQDIDVVVAKFNKTEDLEVELANNSWEDVVDKQSTSKALNGIINFKVRAPNEFGIKVISPSKEKVKYTIAVHAGSEQKKYLGSPFTKISKKEMEEGGTTTNSVSGKKNGVSIMLYILLGLAILVIGLLASKLLGKKSASVILLIISTSFTLQAQNSRDRFYIPDEYDSYMDDIEKLMDSLGGVNDKFDKFKDSFKKFKDFNDKYKNLTDCMKTAPIQGEPRIPSFCYGQDNDCSSCFEEARENFNKTRYLFTQLATIYHCTKGFSEAAIAFGDNVSGYHGVSGMAWQTQKRNIEKSVVELQKAYDNKYDEFVKSLHNNLIELSRCEARYGLDDWYDRFGYVYFEFMRDKYKRTD
jgi:hypothetical protein